MATQNTSEDEPIIVVANKEQAHVARTVNSGSGAIKETNRDANASGLGVTQESD